MQHYYLDKISTNESVKIRLQYALNSWQGPWASQYSILCSSYLCVESGCRCSIIWGMCSSLRELISFVYLWVYQFFICAYMHNVSIIYSFLVWVITIWLTLVHPKSVIASIAMESIVLYDSSNAVPFSGLLNSISKIIISAVKLANTMTYN